MLRYLPVISALLMLTSCSEMKVIGTAALRELRADGINVEQVSFRYHQKLAAHESSGERVLMAKGETVVKTDRLLTDGAAVKKMKKNAKTKKVRGLWEMKGAELAALNSIGKGGN